MMKNFSLLPPMDENKTRRNDLVLAVVEPIERAVAMTQI